MECDGILKWESKKAKTKGQKKEPEKELNLPCKQLRNSKNSRNCFWCFSIKQSASERKVYLKYMNLSEKWRDWTIFFPLWRAPSFPSLYIWNLYSGSIRQPTEHSCYLSNLPPIGFEMFIVQPTDKAFVSGEKGWGGGVRVEGLEGCDKGSSSQRLFSYCYFC